MAAVEYMHSLSILKYLAIFDCIENKVFMR